jgi:large subunit ribosomal protein L24
MATKRFAPKLRIKSGDQVMVITGEDKGKTGTVTKIFPTENRAIVEGVRLASKHRKPTQTNAGGIEQIELPIHISNLMVVDAKTGKPTRVGRREEGGKLVRYSKKSGQTIA